MVFGFLRARLGGSSKKSKATAPKQPSPPPCDSTDDEFVFKEKKAAGPTSAKSIGISQSRRKICKEFDVKPEDLWHH